MEYQFNLQNPRKQTKMWIFETNKNPFFNISLGIFQQKWGQKPCIMMYLGNIHFMYMIPVTFGNFFFQIFQKWPISG